jgi:pilus assembly protein CpaE
MTPVLAADHHAAARSSTAGQLIAVYSGKGGVGRSTIALNLACALSAEQKRRVVLVDLDLQFGDLLTMIAGAEVGGNLVDLAGTPVGEFEPKLVADALIDGPGGVTLLAAPLSPEFAEVVDKGTVQLGMVLDVLAKGFDEVIIDCGRHLGDAVATVLDRAQRVILVTSPTMTSLKSLRVSLSLLAELSVPDERIAVVLNRNEDHSNFSPAQVARTLEHPLLAVIPYDSRTAVTAVDTGEPFVLTNPRAAVSTAVMRLAAEVAKQRTLLEVAG